MHTQRAWDQHARAKSFLTYTHKSQYDVEARVEEQRQARALLRSERQLAQAQSTQPPSPKPKQHNISLHDSVPDTVSMVTTATNGVALDPCFVALMDRILGVQLGSRQALDDEADEASEDPAAEQGKPNSYLNQGRDDSMVLDDAAGTIQIPPCSPRSDCIDKLDTAQTSQAAITGEKTSAAMELDSSLHEVVTTIAASTEEQLDEVVALDDVKSATAAVSVAAKSAIEIQGKSDAPANAPVNTDAADATGVNDGNDGDGVGDADTDAANSNVTAASAAVAAANVDAKACAKLAGAVVPDADRLHMQLVSEAAQQTSSTAYGPKGGTAKDAKWCKQCKPADAVDIVNKRCLTENCDTIVQNRALKTESPRGNGGGLRVDALLSPAPVSKGGEDRCEPGSLGPSPRVTPLCKKPISSFALFANAIRPRLKREYPQMPLAEIARETGRQWKALSVDEQAKWKTASKNCTKTTI